MNPIAALVSKLKPPKKAPTYAEELFYRLDSIHSLLYRYFRPGYTNMGYIVKSIGELQTLISVIDAELDGTLKQKLRNHYKEHATKKDPDVLFLWNTENYHYHAFNTSDSRSIIHLVDDDTLIINIDTIHTDPIYQAFIALDKLYHYAKEYTNFKIDNPLINQLSLNQNVVDYIIKLNAIGEDEEVFNALVLRDTDWLHDFFKPLHDINETLSLSSSINQTTIGKANQRLDTILKWSGSPMSYTQNNSPIATQKDLFDPHFHEKNSSD